MADTKMQRVTLTVDAKLDLSTQEIQRSLELAALCQYIERELKHKRTIKPANGETIRVYESG